jgi:hypothetical protein
MAGRLTVSTLNNDTGVLATQNGMNGIAKAWVYFNGTGTPTINSSFNVSSITDNGTADYTINFTTAMPNANYAVSGSSSGDTTSHYSYICVRMNINGTTSPSAFQTNSIRIIVRNEGGTAIDFANIGVVIHSL